MNYTKYKKIFYTLMIVAGSCIGAGYSMNAKGELSVNSIKKFFQGDEKNVSETKTDSKNIIENNESSDDSSFLEINDSTNISIKNPNLSGIQDFSEIAERATPSVVSIITTKKTENKNSALFVDRELRDFLERFFPFGDMPGMRDDKERQNPGKEMTFGSGVIISKDGYIVTNNHVVEDSNEIIIKFYDDSQAKAEIIGSDELTDLALLKIISKKDASYSYAKFGNSEKVKVGSPVMAIGNPFGIGVSISVGVVSAISRDINAGPYDNFIQTDAAINRGHSGGPLFNINGEIIGINTAIISPSGGNVGIGFAIPSSNVVPILDKLKARKKINRGYIGVNVQMVTQEIANSLGLDNPYGALIVDVSKDSPANNAGLEVGDLIIEIEGQKIKNMRNLPKIISETEIGKKINVKILRNGSEKIFNVLIAQIPEDSSKKSDSNLKSKKSDENEIEETSKEIGLSVKNLSSDFIKNNLAKLNISSGIIVSKIENNSIAANSGIMKGDIIMQIDMKHVKNIDEFRMILKNSLENDKNSLLFLIYRSGHKIFVPVQMK